MCLNYTFKAGNATTRNGAMWIFQGAVIVITATSFYSCVRVPCLSMYVRTYQVPNINNEMHYL